MSLKIIVLNHICMSISISRKCFGLCAEVIYLLGHWIQFSRGASSCRFSVRRRFAVVASQSLKKNDCEIWVMPDEDYVVTRFIFVCVCCRILVSSLLRRE